MCKYLYVCSRGGNLYDDECNRREEIATRNASLSLLLLRRLIQQFTLCESPSSTSFKQLSAVSKTLAVSVDSYSFIQKEKNPTQTVFNPFKDIMVRIQSSEEPSDKLYEMITDVMRVRYCPLFKLRENAYFDIAFFDRI